MPREKPYSFNAAAQSLKETQLKQAGMERYAPSARTLDATFSMVTGDFVTPSVTFAAPPVTQPEYKYCRENNLVFCWLDMDLGIPTIAAASVWYLQLPVVATGAATLGSWRGRRSTTFATNGWTLTTGMVVGPNASFVSFWYIPSQNTAEQQVGTTVPWTWGSGYRFTASWYYEAADLYRA